MQFCSPSPRRATCPTQLILLQLIARAVQVVGQSTLISGLFVDVHRPWSSLCATDHLSHLYGEQCALLAFVEDFSRGLVEALYRRMPGVPEENYGKIFWKFGVLFET